MGRDHTLYSKVHGYVKFMKKRVTLGHTGGFKIRNFISIVDEKPQTIKQDIR